MKYIKPIILICLITFSKPCWGNTAADTITNWQVYKGSQLLFRSNATDCYKPTGFIKKTDDFKVVKIVFFRDTKSYGSQKIKLIRKKEILAEFDFKNKEQIEIAKSGILNLFKNTKESLSIIYHDALEPKGILLGYLILEN